MPDITAEIEEYLAGARKHHLDSNDPDYDLHERALTEITRLRALVDRLVAIPGEHRDGYLDSKEPINWLNVAAPGMPLRIEIDAVRDTCDVLGHKLRDAIRASTEQEVNNASAT